jgi:hypothetical protein
VSARNDASISSSRIDKYGSISSSRIYKYGHGETALLHGDQEKYSIAIHVLAIVLWYY